MSAPGMGTAAEPGQGAAGALLLVLICLTAALAGVIDLCLVPCYVGATIFPIAVPVGALTTYVLPKLGFWVNQKVKGAVLPLVCWLLPVLGIGFVARPEGDVIVQGGNSEQWVAFATILAGALVGFTVVVRGTVAPQSVVRQSPPSGPRDPGAPPR